MLEVEGVLAEIATSIRARMSEWRRIPETEGNRALAEFGNFPMKFLGLHCFLFYVLML